MSKEIAMTDVLPALASDEDIAWLRRWATDMRNDSWSGACAERVLARLDAAERDRDEAREWIADTTRQLTNLTGGGSELFNAHGDEFRADVSFCCDRIRDREARAHDRWINASSRAALEAKP